MTTPNPEAAPPKPLVSDAVADMMAHSFDAKLRFGQTTYPNGTDEETYAPDAHFTLDLAKQAAREQALTYTDLLLCQAYAVLAQEDPAHLRIALVALGSLAIDWVEQLDTEAVCK